MVVWSCENSIKYRVYPQEGQTKFWEHSDENLIKLKAKIDVKSNDRGHRSEYDSLLPWY